MDFVYKLMPIIFALLFGLSPWFLVIVPLANRRAWGWWHRTGWAGSVVLALASLVIKIGADYFGWLLRMWLGYAEEGTFNSIYHTVNFHDLGLLNGVTRLAQFALSHGNQATVSTNVGLGLDFLIVFALFSLVWSIRTRSPKLSKP